MIDVNSDAATGARAILAGKEYNTRADEAVSCPTCNSFDVGVAWADDGRPRMISCGACGHLWARTLVPRLCVPA